MMNLTCTECILMIESVIKISSSAQSFVCQGEEYTVINSKTPKEIWVIFSKSGDHSYRIFRKVGDQKHSPLAVQRLGD